MADPHSYYFTPVSISTSLSPTPTPPFYFAEGNQSERNVNSFPTLEVADFGKEGELNQEDLFFWNLDPQNSFTLSPSVGMQLLNCFTNPSFLDKNRQRLLVREGEFRLKRNGQSRNTLDTIDYLWQIPKFSSNWWDRSGRCFPFWNNNRLVNIDILKGENLYPKEETGWFSGFSKISSQLSIRFFIEKVLPPTAIAVVFFKFGEWGVGRISGKLAIGSSCLWLLYSLNFMSLVFGAIKSQVKSSENIQDAYNLAESISSTPKTRRIANFEIAKAESSIAKSCLYWIASLSLIGFVCYKDKTFKPSGPFAFIRSFPSYSQQATSALKYTPFGVLATAACLYGLYEISSLWFDLYHRMNGGGFEQKTLFNRGFSALSTFALGIPLLARASYEIETVFFATTALYSNTLSFKNLLRLQGNSSFVFKELTQSRIIGARLFPCLAIFGIGIGICHLFGQWDKRADFLRSKIDDFKN